MDEETRRLIYERNDYEDWWKDFEDIAECIYEDLQSWFNSSPYRTHDDLIFYHKHMCLVMGLYDYIYGNKPHAASAA